MLLIERIPETNNVKSDYVKCPVCRGGRLFDKPAGDKAVVIVVHGTTSEKLSQRLIVKCPKCSQKFYISIEVENPNKFVHSSTAGHAEKTV